MIRRVFSVAFFVLGGWLLSGELLVAFIDFHTGWAAIPIVLAVALLFAAPLLLLGCWLDPGERWRDLGLTLLITCGIAVFSGLACLIVFNDPTIMRFIEPPPPKLDIAPVSGVLNLLAIIGLGWLLRRPVKTAGRQVDPGSSPG